MEPACRVARLNPCPLFKQQPTNRRNLIFFGPTLLKAINKLHRQKASCSANLDSSVQTLHLLAEGCRWVRVNEWFDSLVWLLQVLPIT